MKKYDIGIIGGGAAGIMAAITAGRTGKSVILIEKNPIIGRKILATGNGRCNITNRNIKIERYHGGNKEFIRHILEQFNQAKTINFFESLGLVLKEEENGRMFPRTDQAASVVEILNFELKRLGVTIVTNTQISKVEQGQGWKILTNNQLIIEVKKLIITTGGKAAHQLGSSGDGIYFAKNLGHKIIPLYPALVPIETTEDWPKEIQGLKITAEVYTLVNDKIISKKLGDLLFTHYGVSGPAIMAQARFIAPELGNKKVQIKIDAYPEGSTKDLDEKIVKLIDLQGAKTIKNCLAGLAPGNLIVAILKNCGLDEAKKAGQISKDERKKIVEGIKNITLTVKALRPFKEAQVTAGGVSLDELKSTMESKRQPGLFFAGEVTDVDGDSGGFNLQWAWSSGYAAGKNASSQN